MVSRRNHSQSTFGYHPSSNEAGSSRPVLEILQQLCNATATTRVVGGRESKPDLDVVVRDSDVSDHPQLNDVSA